MSKGPKRFRLSIVNASEDVPRVIRAYGKACDGEFALVMRPPEQRAALVLVGKEGAAFWKSGDPDGRTRAMAQVTRGDDGRVRLAVLSGPHAGTSFFPYDERAAAKRVGDEVAVAFEPADQFAHLIDSAGADAPKKPTAACSAKDAVTLIKTELKAVPKPGPITLRGQWGGFLQCDDGVPRVELSRKLAAYGTLRITSDPETGWTWRVERAEKWFSSPGSDEGTADTLVRAIERGLAQAMRLLGEACSVRDSRRRAAMDPGYAETHPLRPAKEGRDPTERLVERPPRRERRKAAAPAPVDAPAPVPEPPATAAALDRATREVAAEADAIAATDGAFLWEEGPPRSEIVAWFHAHDMSDVAEAIAAYEAAPDRPVDRFVDGLAARIDADALTERDAKAQLEQLRTSLQTAPALMERARRLILYARRMASSSLCRGKEQREANESIARAQQAYEEARAAIAADQPVDGVRTLRRIGERIALAAAKAARSCAAGQTTLPRQAESPAPTAAATRGRSKPAGATDAPAAGSRRRSRKAPEPDAEKDKALLAAFSAAVEAALKESA